MEEILRDRIIMILGILSLIFFISTISSCSAVIKNKISRDKEIVRRMDLEEKLNRLSQEKAKQDEKLRGLQKELQEEMASIQTAQKALMQEQLVNKSLKEELEKITKLKEALEEDLKEALIQGKLPTSTTSKTKQ